MEDVPTFRDFALEVSVAQAMNVITRLAGARATINHDLAISGLWICYR